MPVPYTALNRENITTLRITLLDDQPFDDRLDEGSSLLTTLQPRKWVKYCCVYCMASCGG